VVCTRCHSASGSCGASGCAAGVAGCEENASVSRCASSICAPHGRIEDEGMRRRSHVCSTWHGQAQL
jgi:hypothetical protein